MSAAPDHPEPARAAARTGVGPGEGTGDAAGPVGACPPAPPRAVDVATLCARGGSKGLPGKNVRDFAGQPLIVHSIRQALACPGLAGVFVSTDDPGIAEVARQAGACVPLLRPAELASDSAPKLPAIEHLVAHLEARGWQIARVLDLQPTSPLREPGDLAAMLATPTEAGLLVSVKPAADNPYFNLIEPDGRGGWGLSKPHPAARRQDLPPVWALNGSMYLWQRAALARAAQHGLWSVAVAPFPMPAWKSVDIDDLDDFEHALWQHHRHSGGPR